MDKIEELENLSSFQINTGDSSYTPDDCFSLFSHYLQKLTMSLLVCNWDKWSDVLEGEWFWGVNKRDGVYHRESSSSFSTLLLLLFFLFLDTRIYSQSGLYKWRLNETLLLDQYLKHAYFNLQHLYVTCYVILLLKIFFIQYILIVAYIPLSSYRSFHLRNLPNPYPLFPSLENRHLIIKLIQNTIKKPE